MRILVTGSAGFLGSNLVRRLREDRPTDQIVGVDNLWTGVRRVVEYTSKFCHKSAQNLDRETDGLFDEVWHLASPASPKWYQSAPGDTVAANVDGVRACLSVLKKGGRILFTSTSEVYGDPLVSPQPETYNGSVKCTGVRACYDESKRLAECILMDHWRHYDTRIKIARLFNAYGPGTLENDGRAVSNFVCQALRGQHITVYGDGRQTRAFTYVDDVVTGLVRLMRDTGDFTGPLNIGTDVETTVMETAQIIKFQTLSNSHIVTVEAVEDDPRQRLPDLTLARDKIGWDPTTLVPIHLGLSKTITYFRQELGLA